MMQDRGPSCCRLPAVVAALLAALVLLPLPTAALSRRTCFCDLRLGPLVFSPLLLDVPNPVLKDYIVSCRRAEAWCPDACRRAARGRLLQGSTGGVSPLRGAAGETACIAHGHTVSATDSPVHVYAVYRISTCRRTGLHYFGRLCCWKGSHSSDQPMFNELCSCERGAALVLAKSGNSTSAALESTEWTQTSTESVIQTSESSANAARRTSQRQTTEGTAAAAPGLLFP